MNNCSSITGIYVGVNWCLIYVCVYVNVCVCVCVCVSVCACVDVERGTVGVMDNVCLSDHVHKSD